MKSLASLLLDFLKLVQEKPGFHQSHISLYAVILAKYGESPSDVSFRVSRRELMGLSAIRSIATYHMCISDFVDCGLMHYEPSFHPRLGSRVTLIFS